MKLKGIGKRSCWYTDHTKGMQEILSPEKIIEIDISTEEGKQDAFALISGLRAVPLDSQFVPEKGSYKALAQFSFKEDGKTIEGRPGQSLTLGREKATECMVKGLCIPSNPDQWRVSDLLSPRMPIDTTVKRMFDDVPEEKPRGENWAKTYGVRR